MALEDVALLRRHLHRTSAGGKAATSIGTSTHPTTPSLISQSLAAFERQRLPRVRSISRDQTLRSELAYKLGGFSEVPAWDPVYRAWVDDGPDATPEPPVDERAVFEPILKGLQQK